MSGMFGGGPNTPGNGPRNGSWDQQSPLAWSSPNNQGHSALVKAGTREIGVVDLRAPGWCTGRELSIVCGLDLDGEDPDSFVVDDAIDSSVRGHLRWQIGSAQFSADFDWLNGTCLSVPAAQVQVLASYRQIVLDVSKAAAARCPGAPDFRVNAGIALGSIGRNSNPARLTEIVQLGVLGKARIQVPNFAISWTAQIVAGNVSSVQVATHGFGLAYANITNVVAPSTNVGQYDVDSAFPLRGGVRFLTIENPSETDPVQVFVIFGLSL